MKRRIAPPPIDYTRDRPRWDDLIAQAHRAVADGSPEARSRLAEAGLKARNVWTPPAPYPEGLLCLGFAHLAYAWGRQTDAALREVAGVALIQAAGMADQVLQAVDAVATAGVPVPSERAVRLPYADV